MANQKEIEVAQRLSQAGKTDYFDAREGLQDPSVFSYNRATKTSEYCLQGRVYPDGVTLNFEYLTEAQAQQLMAVTRDW